MSFLTHLECSRTGKRYDADTLQNLSEVGAPLLARYDLEAAGGSMKRDRLGAPAQRYVAVSGGPAGRI